MLTKAVAYWTEETSDKKFWGKKISSMNSKDFQKASF